MMSRIGFALVLCGLLGANQATAPVAVDDLYRFPSQAPYSADAAHGVLANDTGLKPLSATLISAPAHGTLRLNPDGSFGYTPTGIYHGFDAFTYRAAGGGPASDVAIVTLVVVAPPVVADDAYTLTGGLAVGPDRGVQANDSDPNGLSERGVPLLPMLASVVTPPARGRLILYPDGAFSYIADAGYEGADRFTYKVTNTVATSRPATVTLTVKRNP